ncbi:lipid A phosphoethanolamine transferase, partial [Enterobacter cloacae complex sp. 2DZ2F20B]
DKYLENPEKAEMFAHLQQQAEIKEPRRHVEQDVTIMGWLGYTSPNCGIDDNNNWCKRPDNPTQAAQ